MKSTVLLSIMLFLISAPAPDANDIAELTSNFIVPEQLPGLEASETSSANHQQGNHSNAIPQPDAEPASQEFSVQQEPNSAARTIQSIKDKVQGKPST